MLKNKEINPFPSKVWLASPTMHGEELKYMELAYKTNWMSTIGENIDQIEKITCKKSGARYAVALSSGTAALHMAIRTAAVNLYGEPQISHGALKGKKVFCSDVTFDASVNPIIYEDGTPVFIDSEKESWNMDPKALEKAFELYPDVKIVVLIHLYGTPASMDEIRKITRRHGAVIVEDAAEALGASYKGKKCGTLGAYGVLSFNGNKIITGSSGGMFLTDKESDAARVAKWSTQAREAAPWYQHEELGYNYRISNVVAGVIRGQYNYLEEHIQRKKEIYQRYQEGFKNLPVQMNPVPVECEPNYWLSCILIDQAAMCRQIREKTTAEYVKEPGKTCPTQILEALGSINAEGRPIWKPMHMQPIYKNSQVITAKGRKERTDSVCKTGDAISVGEDLFERGLCLPSDIKMTEAQQEIIVEIVKKSFKQ